MDDAVVGIPIPGTLTNNDAAPSGGPGALLPLREFLIGPENRQVAIAVESVLEVGPAYHHPVVLYGPSGTGKSHLAVGLVNVWKGLRRRPTAIYSPAIDFARDLADAFETRTIEDFQSRYRNAGLWAIDDIQRLVGKQAAQRELIGLIDWIAQTEGKVVITASVAPERIAGLMPGLQSRLIGGLAAPVVLPSLQTRRALLRRLADERDVEIDDVAVDLLAAELPRPLPVLAAAIVQMQLQLAGRSEIGAEDAREYLAGRERGTPPTLKQIAAATAAHFAVKVADLRSPSRRRAVVAARDVAMYLARSLTGKSLRQIGEYFDGRDHTTVSHGCGKMEKMLKSDPAVRASIEQLRDRLRPAG